MDSSGNQATDGPQWNTAVYSVTGDISVTGTVDGRDVATDGAKLDGVEPLADVTDEANVSVTASVVANTAKVSNATHTGDVTGSTALTIADGAVGVAKLADGTDGELITWDSLGSPATVGAGTATHVLTSNGAGNAPTFQEAAGGGISEGDAYTNPAQSGGLVYTDASGNLATDGLTTTELTSIRKRRSRDTRQRS